MQPRKTRSRERNNMKRENIEKQLKEAGVADDKLKGIVDQIMAENGKDIESEKAKATAKESELEKANQTIVQLQDTVKKFDGKDPEKLQQDLNDLQAKYDTDINTERKKASDISKGYALKEALQAAGVQDPDYLIYKHGGVDKFAFTDDKPIGIEDILKPYKEASPHLFKETGASSSVTVSSGASHGAGSNTPDYDKMTDEEYYAAITKKE